jgi:Putative transposase.
VPAIGAPKATAGPVASTRPASSGRRPAGLSPVFCRKDFLGLEAAADVLTWQHSRFSVDASVRISLADRDVLEYFRSLEHLLRYCARPAFALDRLSVVPGTGNSPERVRYTLPRHKRGNWVGPGRTDKSTRSGASGVIELTPFEFLDRLAALIPPPRRHRHRYRRVFAPNHPLRQAVTALPSGISATFNP